MAFVGGIGYLLELETPEKSYTRNPDSVGLLLTFVIYLTIINLVLLHPDESGFWSNVRTG